ncbi:MAG: ATP-binding protein [Acidobacteria bacterium]|nr:ATP-binding protein [Acidobacteriota bacterium]
MVRADREAIEQALVTLLSNSSKYIGEGEKRIRVSLSAENGSVRLRVEDTGIGMDEDEITHIFERFSRGKDEHVRSVAGSGMGLTIVKHIVAAHGGEVLVESAPDRGSAFTIALPGALPGAR